jgi:hypothetical protein
VTKGIIGRSIPIHAETKVHGQSLGNAIVILSKRGKVWDLVIMIGEIASDQGSRFYCSRNQDAA